MPKLTPDEVDEFLGPAGVARLATIDAETGAPSLAPIGYVRRDRELMITARARSAWLHNIEADPRVCCLIDSEQYPLRKVTIAGEAEIRFAAGRDDEWRDVRNPPYNPDYRPTVLPDGREEWSWLEAYSVVTSDQPRALVVVSLDRSKVTTFRMPLVGESVRGSWASRYYEGSTAEFVVSSIDDAREQVKVVRMPDPSVPANRAVEEDKHA
jgi:nitroimidazol reductase NimA-like FMN-containing flavoprotein (pyridoxamine 5'-phosphate oxidase superfamily)